MVIIYRGGQNEKNWFTKILHFSKEIVVSRFFFVFECSFF